MKKTLAALAVLGAFAGSSLAADVTVYGVIDTGFNYTHAKTTADGKLLNESVDRNTKSDNFTMDSGNNSATRWGLKGTEQIGDLSVSFKLENGFKADSGALGTDGKIFDREATLALGGAFGTVYAGRMGTLVSDTGSVGFYGAMASAFGSGWGDYFTGHTAVMANYTSRFNNTIAYVSPDVAGLKIYAQYAMGDKNENKNSDDRYAAIGAEWNHGPIAVGALVDWLDKGVDDGFDRDTNMNDQYTFNLAGSYDCGFAKTFLAVQYYKDARDVASVMGDFGLYDEDDRGRNAIYDKQAVSINGYGVHLSTQFDALGGTWKAGVGYSDGDVDYADVSKAGDVKAYTVSLGYEYSLSKRTTLYSGAGYVKRELDYNVGTAENAGSWDDKAYTVQAGLVHRF